MVIGYIYVIIHCVFQYILCITPRRVIIVFVYILESRMKIKFSS